MGKSKTSGGLDYCLICWEPLSAEERLRMWETDNTCDNCLKVIKDLTDDIDDNIKGK